MLGGAGSEPFAIAPRMNGLGSFADEWKHAVTIKVGKLPLKVLPLERILASKLAANRPKDRRVIPVLQNALRTLRSRPKKTTRRPKTKFNTR